jgi:hypothetical protein
MTELVTASSNLLDRHQTVRKESMPWLPKTSFKFKSSEPDGTASFFESYSYKYFLLLMNKGRL